MLHQRSLIDITQVTRKERRIDPARPPHLRNARHAHLRVVLNGHLRIHYDTHDSWEVDEEFLGESDVYFKRSYAPARLASLGLDHLKVHALGLNYKVFRAGFDRFALRRAATLGSAKEKLRELSQAISLLDRIRFVPRLRHLEALPDPETPPRVLFMASAWDPDDRDASEEKEERRRINKTRAECIGLLREAFGCNFHGGFIRDRFAVQHYPNHLLPDEIQSSKRNYLERVRAHPICVATTGLHGSIGWKFAEYVAFSRAIVSERLNYEVLGGFAEGTNYLPFDTPQMCVAQAQRLVEDRNLRIRMMTENARYYQAYVRPDALVLNTLLTALLQVD